MPRESLCAGLVISAMAMILVALYFLNLEPSSNNPLTFTVDQSIKMLMSLGWMIVAALSPFPAELVAATNGAIYGQVVGFALTWAGALFGATIAFAMARVLGREPITRLIGARRVKTFEGWVDQYGVFLFLMARFVPIIPFFVLNYGAGLTGLGFGRYLTLTAIGIIPMTTLCVILGDRVKDFDWQAVYMISALAVLIGAAIMGRQRH